MATHLKVTGQRGSSVLFFLRFSLLRLGFPATCLSCIPVAAFHIMTMVGSHPVVDLPVSATSCQGLVAETVQFRIV
jgi:hypothetical protein